MVEPADGFGTRMRHEPRALFGLTSYLLNRTTSGPRAFGVIAMIAVALASPVDVAAQSGGDGFLFRAPRVTLSLHGGYAQARASSDLFDELTDLLIFDKGDLTGAFTFGGDVGIRASDRLDVVLSGMYGRSGVQSEDRDFFDPGPSGNDSLPILQDTHLTRVPLTANLKFYLSPRGRTIGRFAWVPSTVTPYVGAGAGVMYHEFKQEGDFVDYVDESIIFDTVFRSSGWSPLAQVLGGFEIALGPRVALMAEGRYLWSSADLDLDFEGFEPIDLAGFQATAGLSFRL